MQVTSAQSTELFVGDPEAPLHVVRVGYTGAAGPTVVRVAGDGLSSDAVTVSGEGTVEIPVRVDGAVPGGPAGAARTIVAIAINNDQDEFLLTTLALDAAGAPLGNATIKALKMDGVAYLWAPTVV